MTFIPVQKVMNPNIKRIHRLLDFHQSITEAAMRDIHDCHVVGEGCYSDGSIFRIT